MCCHPERLQEAAEIGTEKPHEVQQKMQSPAAGDE